MNCKFFFIYWLKEAVSNSLKLPLALVFFFSDTVENFKSKSYKRGSSLSMYISNLDDISNCQNYWPQPTGDIVW